MPLTKVEEKAEMGIKIEGKLPNPRRINRLAEACATFNIDGEAFEKTGDGKENILDATIEGVLADSYPEGIIGKD